MARACRIGNGRMGRCGVTREGVAVSAEQDKELGRAIGNFLGLMLAWATITTGAWMMLGIEAAGFVLVSLGLLMLINAALNSKPREDQ
jgi:hypothetical protein